MKRILVVIMAALVMLSAFACAKTEEPEVLYQNAVKDAVFAEQDEIQPVVELTKNSDMAQWDESGEKVLMVFWHKYPESYPNGETVSLDWGDVWCMSMQEMQAWYQKNGKGVTDWNERFCQLIGLPLDKGYTYFTTAWVEPDDMKRPAYDTDVTEQVEDIAFDDTDNGQNEAYVEWFDGNIIWSYFDSAYPWTRLGYTYDWADNGTEYGLSEFLIVQGSEIEVESTLPTEEFVKMLDAA